MTTQIQEFQFQASSIRVQIDERGNTLFCGKDVCEVLGYANHNDTIKKLCKQDGVSNSYPIIDNLGREQYPLFITEGNLYRLIIKSNKPEAEPFETWVCDEVLPTIRKTGSYIIPEPTDPPDYIHWKTHNEIKSIVNLIADRFSYASGWSYGIQHRLRKVTGRKSPAPFETKHLPLIANDLIQVMAIANAVKDINREFEAKVLKLLIRDNKALEDLEPLINEAQAQQKIVLSDLNKEFIAKYLPNIDKFQINHIDELLK